MYKLKKKQREKSKLQYGLLLDDVIRDTDLVKLLHIGLLQVKLLNCVDFETSVAYGVDYFTSDAFRNGERKKFKNTCSS